MKAKLTSPLSTTIFLTLSVVYASGYYELVQSSVWLTLLLTLLFPLIFWPLVQPVDNSDEIKRILWLESGFNLVCFLIVARWVDIPYLDHALIIFFAVQAIGFISVQLKKRAYLSVAISLCLTAAIAQWIYGSSNTQHLGDAQLLLFGTPVPWQLKVIYGAWLVQLLFVEYKHVLPKMTLAAIHIASFAVAIFADDFFHARIITASHFLFLSLCFDIKAPNWGGEHFARIEKIATVLHNNKIQRSISGLMLLAAVLSTGSLLI